MALFIVIRRRTSHKTLTETDCQPHALVNIPQRSWH